MKTERRHELQTNALADWLGAKVEAIRPYTQAITASLLVVVVILGVYAYQSNRSTDREAKGWDLYYRAIEAAQSNNNTDKLSEVAETYAESALGVWARLSLADIQYARGAERLFSDRTAANVELQQAINNYLNARDHASSGTLQERAAIGLARAYEAHNELDKARESYQSIVTRWPNGTYVAEARDRLADLDQPSTKQFYDWFAQRTQQSSLGAESGTPGSRPPFSFDSLPKDADFFPASSQFGEKKSAPATGGSTPADSAPNQTPPAEKSSGDKAPTSVEGGATTPSTTAPPTVVPQSPPPAEPPAQPVSGSPKP